MKIIQSFAQFDDGCMYAGGRLNGTEVYLNFYSFFLSYLTLKKYYGYVTMYCNQKAYDTFIKFIPYDEIIIKENIHKSQLYWSVYKVDVINEQTESFIHVDSDVFIFDDLFKPFIDNQDKYDIIVQNTSTKNINPIKDFVYDYHGILRDNNICFIDEYDGRCMSGGVIGMNINVKNKYIENTTKMYKLFNINNLDDYYIPKLAMILEELTIYLTALHNNFKWFDILPHEDIKIYGEANSGGKNKYTHMWLTTKFMEKYIILIKNKIKNEFNDYYHIVKKYDDYIKKFNIKYL